VLKKSSPLKLLGQMEPNLAGSIYVRSSIKLLHLIPFGQQTWPLLLKIEHGNLKQSQAKMKQWYDKDTTKSRDSYCVIAYSLSSTTS
jgi:hypothetical protein